jgi:hypothetical protein
MHRYIVTKHGPLWGREANSRAAIRMCRLLHATVTTLLGAHAAVGPIGVRPSPALLRHPSRSAALPMTRFQLGQEVRAVYAHPVGGR